MRQDQRLRIRQDCRGSRAPGKPGALVCLGEFLDLRGRVGGQACVNTLPRGHSSLETMTQQDYTPDFRALCAELLQELCCHYRSWELKEGHCSDAMTRAQAALSQPLLEQSDETLKYIRKNTPRYRMSVTISTYDSTIDTRMRVIWSALDLNKEILESVSLPEQLPPLGNK